MTYTIAMLGDLLIATAVDGDDAMMAARLAAVRAQGIEFADDDLTLTEGLTLIGGREGAEEAEDAGAEIVYSGTDMGWLEDAEGRMGYWAAARIA